MTLRRGAWFLMRRSRRGAMAAAFVALALPLLGTTARAETPDERAFLDRVEPLLRKHCYSCHSHAATRIKGGLTLDSRAGWLKGGNTGPAVVPGDPGASLLVKAIRHDDPDLAMPPAGRIDADAIAIITRWVEAGAADPRVVRPVVASRPADWWSLRPLENRPPPDVPAALQGWVRNSIDAFIAEQLASRELMPAPEASRRDLIRRLSFDLLGLPPTFEEVRAFEVDPRPDAYERLVDRLLASPHHGERWARLWLDQVHWAETDGMEHDLIRPNAYRYRDYLIHAFNADRPYPRWIREQLAADVFFPNEPNLTPALGFLGAGPWDQSTAVTAPRTFDYLDRDDMVTQTMTTFASTTVQCARCHDHKFDPIPQADYYALQAVFAGVGRGEVEFDEDPATHASRVRWSRLAAAAAQGDRAVLLGPEAARLVAAWEADRPSSPVAWHVAQPETFVSTDGSVLRRRPDGVIESRGPRPAVDSYLVTAPSPVASLGAVQLEVLANDALPQRGPGRMDNGNLHLSEFNLKVFEPGRDEPRTIPVSRASADFDQAGWTIAHAIDGNESTAWGIHPQVGMSHRAVFEIDPPVKLAPGSRLAVVMRQRHGGGHLIGDFRLSVTSDPAERAAVLPPEVAAALTTPAPRRGATEQLALARHVVGRAADEALRRLPPPSRVYAGGPRFLPVAGYKPWSSPKPVHVLRRGDVNQPVGEAVGPGSLACIAALPARFDSVDSTSEGARRAALADWLAHPANPLVPRSLANRLWLHHFGRGLVETPNDFGRAGAAPSHPALLDWLAAELLREGGSLRSLHRRIVTSATYRQSTRHDSRAASIDADNRLLWRMNRRRLDSESYRDALLALAGRLDRTTLGGPSVRQFVAGPPRGGDTPSVDYAAFDWDSPGAARRTVYRLVFRTRPDPFLEQLDFPDASQIAPTRPFSASPLQALALLNDGFVLRQSEHLAARLAQLAPDLPGQVRLAVHQALQREPTDAEQSALAGYAAHHGLAALGRVLVNMNEFLFLE